MKKFWRGVALSVLILSLITVSLELALRFKAGERKHHILSPLSAQKPTGAIRILCLGDSITFGEGSIDSYPSQLQNMLGPAFQVINAGMVGANSHFLLGQLPALLEKYRPQLVLAMMGHNDKFIQRPKLSKKTPAFWEELRVLTFFKLWWQQNSSTRPSTEKKEMEELLAQGQNAQAQNQLEADWKKKGAQSESLFAYLHLLYDNHQTAKMEEVIVLSLKERTQDSARLYYLQGLARLRQGKREEAIVSLLQARQLSALASELRGQISIKLAEAHAELGHVQDFLLWAQRARSEGGDLHSLLVIEGDFYGHHGPKKKALQIYQKLAAERPEQSNHYLRLAPLVLQFQGEKEYRRLLQRAQKNCPERELDFLRLESSFLAEKKELGELKKVEEKISRLEQALPSQLLTLENYQKLAKILDSYDIPLLALPYPRQDPSPLKNALQGEARTWTLDYREAFAHAVSTLGAQNLFSDFVGGNMGHLRPAGGQLLAQVIADFLRHNHLWENSFSPHRLTGP